MVVALGILTEHWRVIARDFPCILNCCINVCKAFPRLDDESTAGSGFDRFTRERIMAKETWSIVWGVAMVVLREFGLLIVLCNHGKHRSLSLAYELAFHTGAELVSIRHPNRPRSIRSVGEVMDVLLPRLTRHVEVFGSRPHPVVGIHVCQVNFCGVGWAQQHLPAEWRLDTVYHCLRSGDILVEISCSEEESVGWCRGVLVDGNGSSPDGWYPPSAAHPMPVGYFARPINLLHSLVMSSMP